MAKVLDMPKLSPTMEEGQISAWHKNVGDAVAVDDLLAEVETDKATMEFRAFDKGTLLAVLAPAGTVVKLGAPVAVLGEKGEDISKYTSGAPAEAKPEAQPAKGEEQPRKGEEQPRKGEEPPPGRGEEQPPKGEEPPRKGEEPPRKGEEPPRKGEEPPRKGEEHPAAASADGRVKASPYVRKLAREQDLDLRGVNGTGPNGRVIARDLDGLDAKKGKGAPTAWRSSSRARESAARSR